MSKYKFWIIGAVAIIVIISVYLNYRQQEKRRLLEDIDLQRQVVNALIPSGSHGDYWYEKQVGSYIQEKHTLDSLLIEYKTRFE